MSEFYNYISKIIINYLNETNLTRGDRYSIQFENLDDVVSVYNSINHVSETLGFETGEFSVGIEYKTNYVMIGSVKLIIAKTDHRIKPDFLTYLRNQVDKEGSEFDNTALLFIHNSNLDSIIGGSKRLETRGMPLHVESIEKQLNEDLESSKLSAVDKTIVKKYLELNKDNVYENTVSIFDYKDIFNTIEKKRVDKEQFNDFGMFFDDQLYTFIYSNEDSLEERITANMKLYNKVDRIHKYSDLSELDQVFDEKGARELSTNTWKELFYENVLESKEKFDDQSKPEYRAKELRSDNSDYHIWDRPEGDTKAKLRRRHIVIFNEEKKNEVSITLKFSIKVKEENISSKNKNVKVKTNNKSIILTFNKCNEEVMATKMTYFNLKFNILVLNCSHKLLENIKDQYQVDFHGRKKIARLLIVSESETIILNNHDDETKLIELKDKRQEETIYPTDRIIIKKIGKELEDIELIELALIMNESKIPLGFKNEIIQMKMISSFDVWKEKIINTSDFNYEKLIDPISKKESIKLSQGTSSYYPTGEFRKLLNFENEFIHSDYLSFKIMNNKLVEVDLQLPEDLYMVYLDFLNFFKCSNRIPSLTYFDDEYQRKAAKYVEVFFDYLNRLSDLANQNLEMYKEINKIGIIKENDGELKIHFAPWHPLNVMYQIKTKKMITTEDLEKEISKYLSNNNLVPYILDESEALYNPIDNGLMEWTTYVEHDNTKYNASNKYVPKIVANKIKDFITHFEYLFISHFAPIKIALVNLGDCKEVLQGIFDYYISELKNKKNEELRPIELHIYDGNQSVNAFEELSGYTNIDSIKEHFEVKLNTKNYDEYDVLSMYRSKVHFYKFDCNQVDYNHLTFYKMNDEIKPGNQDMSGIETGICLDGIVSDISSVFVGKEYVTGFGSQNLMTDDLFIQNVITYNAFVEYVHKLAKYDPNTVLVTAIKEEESQLLKDIYEKTHWVTFIDPKVDLNYFKNNEESKDLMIIHYNDQYTTSSGYDAITVTQKSSIYMKVIRDFLSKETGLTKEFTYDMKEIINSFNVFNGEWLLRLVSRQLTNRRDQFAREKLSLFSAVKAFEAHSLKSEIYWIPISVEEIFRVAGSVGMAQKESIFNPKKFGYKGSFSDDILMVGINIKSDELEVMYYPIEVKVGNNDSGVKNKAKEQVTNAKKYLNSKLFKEDNFYSKLLRNQLMQLTITQIKKIMMYKMWSEKDWTALLSGRIMSKLIDDDYKLVDQFDDDTHDCGVITFTKNAIVRRKHTTQHNDYTVAHFEYPMQDAFKYLSMSLEEICKFNQWPYIPEKKDYLKVSEESIKQVYETKPTYDQTLDEGSIKEYQEAVNEEKELPNKEVATSITSDVDTQSEMKIKFGRDQLEEKEILWLPNSTDKVMHTNTGIIGTMGTGKTQFTKSLITQIKQQDQFNVDGKEIDILIFDYKGDYIKDDFVKATNAKVYHLYNLPFNPLSIYQGKTFKPMLPLHTANELRDTIANAFSLGNVQKNSLSTVLEEAYESVGIIPNDPSSWSKDAPTMDTVFKTYTEGEYPTNDSLYAALNELNKFKIFESNPQNTKPLFDLIDGVTVINLQGYSESIQNLVVAITLDTFYAQMQAQGHSEIRGNYRQLTRMILVDEADNFLGKNFNSIKKILKEGREFGVGTILSTQFLKHFSTSENEYAQYILTWIIHKVNDISAKDIGNIFSMTNKSDQESWLNNIKNLEKHFSIVNLGGNNEPKYVRDLAFWELEL